LPQPSRSAFDALPEHDEGRKLHLDVLIAQEPEAMRLQSPDLVHLEVPDAAASDRRVELAACFQPPDCRDVDA
jgi:hypothetical protein